MEIIIDTLSSAKGEIIAGLIFAVLGWLYHRFRVFNKMYKRKQQELEQMKAEMSELGATKEEVERLQEELKQSEAQGQNMKTQLEALQVELQQKNEALKQSESQGQNMKTQLDALQHELQQKNEALKQSEAQRQNMKTQLEALRHELKREKAKPKLPPMSDWDFFQLCMSGDARKVEEAIKNGANVNARGNDERTALMWAKKEVA